MKKLSILTLLALISVCTAAAQDDDNGSNTEFFAGFSVLRTHYRVRLPNPPTPVIVAFDAEQTLPGFNGEVTHYLRGGLGLTADVSANFRTHKTPDPLGPGIIDKVRVINVAGGPQYKFNRGGTVQPFLRALAGVANTGSKLTIPGLVSDSRSSTDFAMLIGGGLDVRVHRRLALRVVQADYNPIFLGDRNRLGFSGRADNFRLSFGAVFK